MAQETQERCKTNHEIYLQNTIIMDRIEKQITIAEILNIEIEKQQNRNRKTTRRRAMKRGIWGGNWTRLFALCCSWVEGPRRRAAFIEAGRRRVEGEGRLPVWKVFIAFSFQFHFYSYFIIFTACFPFYCAFI